MDKEARSSLVLVIRSPTQWSYPEAGGPVHGEPIAHPATSHRLQLQRSPDPAGFMTTPARPGDDQRRCRKFWLNPV